MAAFSAHSFTPNAFCQVGDAEKADKAAIVTLPHEFKRFWEVGNAEAVSLLSLQEVGDAQGYGSKPSCEENGAEKKPSCVEHASGADYPFDCVNGHGFLAEGDDDADDFVSPRVSFSRDFVMSDAVSLVESASDRIFSESKQEERDAKESYASEFSFLKDNPAQGVSDQAKDFMLSADELFFDGKLLPLRFQSIWAPSNWSAPSSPSKPPLSWGMELSLPSTSLPRTSPRTSSPSPETSTLPSILSFASSSASPSSSSVIKCSATLKDLFKSKKTSKESSSSSQLAENVTSCGPPVASRSFWPFSRSKSTGVSKITAPPSLHCRSKSAHESHTCDALSFKELDAIDGARLSISSTADGSKSRGTIPIFTENFHTNQLEATNMAEDMNACKHSDHYCVGTCVHTSESGKIDDINVKRIGAQGDLKASGKKIIGAGSPGRTKGGLSAGVKGNGGTIVLRNLQRCNAEKKVGRDGWRGLSRRGSFPVGARVSPVLNVGVCRGPSAPTIGFFRFKKEKHAEAAINWRHGA